ncbi:DUF1822 family protein [Microcoleus sp. FACHB-SPT15]|uniref:DUF1822 family protein n=1 Tax=Microcoleus sp. FACHB-SPT15 TaxID=2692830 RepID=UPI0017855E60|nr:DUF1822 family protein [Microcoleus sp. FACHB-SPT15]MBD1803885.1 DUF1822 family protein [Microcoleus sp. FACHB-SPT15]
MLTLIASQQGLERIRQARNEKGWIIEDDRWLREASKVLEPDTNWEAEDYVAGRIFAPGISLPTWKRFLEGKRRINAKAFKAFCQVLEVNWEDVRSPTPSTDPLGYFPPIVEPSHVRSFIVLTGTIQEVNRPRVEVIVTHLKQLMEDDAFVTIEPWNWQPVEQVLPRRTGRSRSIDAEAPEGSVRRAKEVDLGAEQVVVLVVQITPESEEVGVCVWVYPAGDALHLPVGLQLFVLDEFGILIPELQDQARSVADSMQLEFGVKPGEPFSVGVALGDVSITEDF